MPARCPIKQFDFDNFLVRLTLKSVLYKKAGAGRVFIGFAGKEDSRRGRGDLYCAAAVGGF